MKFEVEITLSKEAVKAGATLADADKVREAIVDALGNSLVLLGATIKVEALEDE